MHDENMQNPYKDMPEDEIREQLSRNSHYISLTVMIGLAVNLLLVSIVMGKNLIAEGFILLLAINCIHTYAFMRTMKGFMQDAHLLRDALSKYE